MTQEANSVENQPSNESSNQEVNQNQESNQVVENKEQKPDISAARFAALAKQEKKLQSEKAALKEAQEQAARVSALKELAKKNPAAILDEFGLSLDDIIAATLESQPEEVDPLEALRREVEGLKSSKQKEIEESRKLEQEAKDKQIEETINKHKQSYRQFVETNADKFELIQLNDAHEMVWEVVEAHYDSTGKVLSPEEAASKVEAYYEKEAEKLLSAKKLAQKQSQVKAPVEQPKEEKISSKTLTSSMVELKGNVKKEYIDSEYTDERQKRLRELEKSLWSN